LTGVVLGRLLPAAEHPVYIVAGPSMGEALPVGSAVVLDQVAPDDLVPGDIVTLQSGPQRAVFTHRIVRIVERDGATWIETRGDANPTADPSITPASAVVGRVAVAIPEAGYVLMLLSTIQGVVLILAVGGLLLALGWWLGSLADEWAAAAARGAVRASATSR
jgi:signal peptidase